MQSTDTGKHNALIRTKMGRSIINHEQFPRKKLFPAFQFNIYIYGGYKKNVHWHIHFFMLYF